MDGVGALGGVEPEFGLPFFGVETVAGKAVVGKNGTNLPVEIHLALRGMCGQEEDEEQDGRNEMEGAHRRGILG
jgi:hypothetical protein